MSKMKLKYILKKQPGSTETKLLNGSFVAWLRDPVSLAPSDAMASNTSGTCSSNVSISSGEGVSVVLVEWNQRPRAYRK